MVATTGSQCKGALNNHREDRPEQYASGVRKRLPQSDDEIELDLTSSDGDSKFSTSPNHQQAGLSGSEKHQFVMQDLNSSGLSHASEPSASNTPSTSCERGKGHLPPRHPRAGSQFGSVNSTVSNAKLRQGGTGAKHSNGSGPSVSLQLPAAAVSTPPLSTPQVGAERYFIGSPRDTRDYASSSTAGYGWETEPQNFPAGSVSNTMAMRVFREFLQLLWELADIFFDGVARTKLVIKEGPARLAGQNTVARNLEKVGVRMVIVRFLCVLAVICDTISRMGRSVGSFFGATAKTMDSD